MKRKFATLILIALLVACFSFPTKVNAAENLSLSKKKITLEINDSSKLKLGKIKATDITWWSSNKTVATVSKWGTVTAKSAGSAKITAKYKDKKYVCVVTVDPYSEWVLFNTDNIKHLADLLLDGSVKYVNGAYYCSPEYFNSLLSAQIEFENNVVNNIKGRDSILQPDTEFEAVEDKNKDNESNDEALKERIKKMLESGSATSD